MTKRNEEKNFDKVKTDSKTNREQVKSKNKTTNKMKADIEAKTNREQAKADSAINQEQAKVEEKWHIEDPDVKITFRRVLAYFIIYSFLGFVVETIYGIMTKGVLESRRSCFYGPFCCIYGLGAAIMIPGLQKFKKSNWTLFAAGALEGSVIEYMVSLIGELVFQIKWWDYSNKPFNINGRICLLYAAFWGILAIGLIRLVNPYIEKFIDSLPEKVYKIGTTFLTVFLVCDLLFTAFGLKVFYTRIIKEYNLQVQDQRDMTVTDEIMNTGIVQYLSKTVFSDERVLKTFPNIKYADKDGKIVWIKDILTDIQPYYIRISPKIRLK